MVETTGGLPQLYPGDRVVITSGCHHL